MQPMTTENPFKKDVASSVWLFDQVILTSIKKSCLFYVIWIGLMV